MVFNVTGRKPDMLRYLPILVGFIFLVLFLGGCSGDGAGRTAGDPARSAGVVRLFSWKEFVDSSAITDFEAEAGITVELVEYETTDEMIARVQSAPGDFDVILLDANLIPLMLELRTIRKLDPELLTSREGVLDMFRRLPLYDPEGEYGVPYLWGTTGLVINTAYVSPETDSWDALWDSRYRGRIGLLDDVREAMLPVLLRGEMSINTADPVELAVAETAAMQLVGNGVAFGETVDLIDQVIKGDLWMAEAYSGDVMCQAGEREYIKYVLPREGFGVWVDSFVISSNTQNQAAAHALIDFFSRPDISARSASTFFYGTPVAEAELILGGREELEGGILPDADDFKRGQAYIDLGDIERIYQRIFSRMKLEAGGSGGGGP